MAQAESHLRKIAILVKHVDAPTAQRLLMQLPTETAGRVRRLAAQLDDVTEREKELILDEFKQLTNSVARETSNDQPAEYGDAQDAAVAVAAARTEPAIVQHRARQDRAGAAATRGRTQPTHAVEGMPELESGQLDVAAECPQQTFRWDEVSAVSIRHALRHERPLVAAIVISQLPTKTAVEVLSKFEADLSAQVLGRLSSLGDTDAAARSSVLANIATKLEEHQKSANAELECQQRMAAILSEAPLELQRTWKQALQDAKRSVASNKNPESSDGQEDQPAMGHEEAQQLTADADLTAEPQIADEIDSRPEFMNDIESAPQDIEVDYFDSAPQHVVNSDARHRTAVELSLELDADLTNPPLDAVDLASSPASNAAVPKQEVNQSFPSVDEEELLGEEELKASFERLLDLPRTSLSTLIHTTESRTVLLALAGASPAFMRRFKSMVAPGDAFGLEMRLKQIDGISIHEIDTAQHTLVQRAKDLEATKQYVASHLSKAKRSSRSAA